MINNYSGECVMDSIWHSIRGPLDLGKVIAGTSLGDSTYDSLNASVRTLLIISVWDLIGDVGLRSLLSVWDSVTRKVYD